MAMPSTAVSSHTPGAERSYRILWIGLLILHALVVGLRLETVPKVNPSSRFATMDSLVHRGTYVIDDSRYVKTLDKVQFNGHFISSKPPLLPTVGAGVYGLYTIVTGWTFDSHEARTIAFMGMVFGMLPHLALLWLFAHFLRTWVTSPRARLLGLTAFALGYHGIGYALGLNNHTPAGFFIFLAFVQMVRVQRGGARSADWILAGLAAGIAPPLDLGAAFFSAAFALLLLRSDWRRTLCIFLPAAAFPLFVHFGLTLYSSGSFLPIYLRPPLFIYPGSRWGEFAAARRESANLVARFGMDGLREPRWLYALHMFIGHHGILAMSPLFLLSLWSILRHALRDQGRRQVAVCVLLASIAMLTRYGLRTFNYGGRCFGFRWALFAAPVWFAFVPVWCEDTRHRGKLILFAICLAVSTLVTLDALRGGWRPSEWNLALRRRGLGSLPSWETVR